jgi:hypothetical protein
MLQELVDQLQSLAKEAYPNIRGVYITSPEDLLAEQNNVLAGLSEY